MKSSFTLIELLITAGIVLFLSAMFLVNYDLMRWQTDLDAEARKVASIIKQAQAQALAGKKTDGSKPNGYGVNFTSSTYTFFADIYPAGTPNYNYDEGQDTIINSFNFPLKISSDTTSTFVFSLPEAKVYQNGNLLEGASIFKITHSETGDSRKISVSGVGKIEVCAKRWWDDSWIKRKPITFSLSSGSTPSSYQVKINIDYTTGMKSDFSDLRFVDYCNFAQLPYWIESKTDDVSAVIWVRIKDPATFFNPQKIYLYYGNSSATSQSSVANTFVREIDGAQPVKGAWNLDETSGSTVNDSSGNGHTGTAQAAVTVNSGGKNNYCRNYAGGTTSYIDIDNTSDFVWAIGTPVSISMWVKSSGATSFMSFMSKDVNGSRGWVFISAGQGATELYANIYQNNTTYIHRRGSGASTIYDSQWHHIVMTWDGTGSYTGIKLYADGVEVTYDGGIGSLSSVQNSSANARLGIYYDTNYTFTGLMDEVIYWKGVALSTSEISDLYNNYGYTTINYPGRVLVRKYSSPEPTAFLGEEETL